MRHRRGMPSDRRDHHGNERGNRSDHYRPRPRHPETHEYRRGGSTQYDVPEQRYNHQSTTRSVDRTIGYQENRKCSDSNIGVSSELSTESFKTYLRNKYCDTNTTNDDKGQLGHTRSDRWRNENLPAGSTSVEYKDSKEYPKASESRFHRQQAELLQQNLPRTHTDGNAWQHIGEFPTRFPGLHKPIPGLGYVDVKSVSKPDVSFDRPNNRRSNYDITGQMDNSSRRIPSLYNQEQQNVEHAKLPLDGNVNSVPTLKEHLNVNCTLSNNNRILPHETKVQHAQGITRKENDFRHSRFEPMSIPRAFEKVGLRGNDFSTTCSANNMPGPQRPYMIHETFQPLNPAVFTHQGHPILRREVPPCPGGIGPPFDQRYRSDEREHSGLDFDQKVCQGKNRQSTIRKRPVAGSYQSLRRDETFQPKFTTDAKTTFRHTDTDPKLEFIRHSGPYVHNEERISISQLQNASKTDGSLLQGKNQEIENVALIPLPLLPPPSPPPYPPPPLPQPSESSKVLSTIECSSKSGNSQLQTRGKTKSKIESGTTIEEQVSSTSTDLDTVTSSVGEKASTKIDADKINSKQEKPNEKEVSRMDESEAVPVLNPEDVEHMGDTLVKGLNKEEHIITGGLSKVHSTFDFPKLVDNYKFDQARNLTCLENNYHLTGINFKTSRPDDRYTAPAYDLTCEQNSFVANRSDHPKGMFIQNDRPEFACMENRRNDHFNRHWGTDNFGKRWPFKGNDTSRFRQVRDRWEIGHRDKYRSYNRPVHEHRRLSGLGINTYSTEFEDNGRRHSTLGYFRPWEKQKAFRTGYSRTDNGKFYTYNNITGVLNQDLFPEKPFWKDDFGVSDKENNLNRCDVESMGRNRGSQFQETGKCIPTKSAEHGRTLSQTSNEIMEEVFEGRRKEGESQKPDTSVKDNVLACDNKVAGQNVTENSIPGNKLDKDANIPGTSDDHTSSCSKEISDKFAEKRREKYNHGHSYSEILPVKGKDRNGRRKRKHGTNKNEVSATKEESVGTEKNVKQKRPKSSEKINFLENSLSIDSAKKSPKSFKDNMLSSELGGSLKTSSRSQLSQVAKPDISTENVLLKKLSNGDKALSRLDSFKIPHVKTNKVDYSITDGKLCIDETLVTDFEKKPAIGEKVKKDKNKVKSSKTEQKKDYKKQLKRFSSDVGEKKAKELSKRKSKRSFGVDLKSLHPKLRHKFSSPSIFLREKKLEIIVEKCDVKKKKQNAFSDEKHQSLKRKHSHQEKPDKKGKNVLERATSSLLTRGKFTLCTPNTLQVKDRKSTKVKEKSNKKDIVGSVIEEKSKLDKAFSSAKKDLLYRALAVNSLRRDKNKPLVEKKSKSRKSMITTDMAKEELAILGKTLHPDPVEEANEIDENNNAIKGNSETDVRKPSCLGLDQPNIEYRPQRTAIGNYATQCLFGPIVSSTFYKAPGKSRVIRNSRETFTGYSKCSVDVSTSHPSLVEHLHSDLNEYGNADTSVDSGTSSMSETLDIVQPKVDISPFIDVSGSETDLKQADSSCDGLEQNSLSLNPDDSCLRNTNRINGREQVFPNVFDNFSKILDSQGIQTVQSSIKQCKAIVPEQMNENLLPDQFEMHKRYLRCKKELAESSSIVSKLRTNQSPTVPVLPVLPMSDPLSLKSSAYDPLLSVYSSFDENKNTCPGAMRSLMGENAVKMECNSLDNVLGDFKDKIQYEPTNEDFEMYRNYQIQRIMTSNVKEGIDLPFAATATSPLHQGPALNISGSSATNVSPSDVTRTVDDSGQIALVDSEDVADLPDQEYITIDDGTTQQRHNSDILNLEKELQDTSNDMFEEIVTDILRDDYLISSINPPDITKEVNYSFGSLVDDKPNTNHLLDSTTSDKASPGLPQLSPKCPLDQGFDESQSEHGKFFFQQRDDVFKSARAPIHLKPTRRPRFEKRFPKPLPRAKPQKQALEKDLYEAAERFLGDFDHKNKRSCCKGNSELLINPVTGKLEPVKMEERKEKELAQETESVKKIDKPEAVKCFDNQQVESKKELEKINWHQESVYMGPVPEIQDPSKKKKDKSVKACSHLEVANKCLAMKKIISKKKMQTLKKKAKAEAARKEKKGFKKTHANKIRKIVNVLTKKIPCIRLKTVVQKGQKDKTPTKKWQKVKPRYRKKEENKKNREESKKENKKNSISKKEAKVKKDKVLTVNGKENDVRKENMMNGKDCKVKKEKVINDKERPKVKKEKGIAEKEKVKVKQEVDTIEKENDIERNLKIVRLKQSCKKCEFTCDTTLTLIRHCNQKHKLSCYRCGKDFEDKEACRYHISQSHNAEICCDVCGTVFQHKGNYERHLRSKYHLENLEFVKVVNQETIEVKAEVTEHDLTSDGDDSCVEIVDHSLEKQKSNQAKKKSLKSPKLQTCIKTNTKSPKLETCINTNMKRKLKNSENENDEENTEVKKANLLQYCKLCRQYYKRLQDHFKTGKHIKRQNEKDGGDGNVLQEDIHTLYLDDTDLETPLNTDDDTVNEEEDYDTLQTMSPSSCTSVVIVSDHDSHYSYEEEDIKPWSCDDDISQQTSPMQTCSSDDEAPDNETSRAQREASHEQSGTSISTMEALSDGENMDTCEVIHRETPVVVSTGKKCSPTLLVKNIAAEIDRERKEGPLMLNLIQESTATDDYAATRKSNNENCGNDIEKECSDEGDGDNEVRRDRKVVQVKDAVKGSAKENDGADSGRSRREDYKANGDDEDITIIELEMDQRDTDTGPDQYNSDDTISVGSEDTFSFLSEDYQVTENCSFQGE